MANYTFGEKKEEYHNQYGNIPVWITPKYEVAKAKAIEVIESGKYGLSEADFWILMNATKSKKMAYTGLIISHNGCLKINDALESKFDPSCVTVEKDGYKGELVFYYCNAEQGIFEVGEVSATNCKNDYPYAMALKRCFDRVVLKLSKLAYSGVYSDSESDEFMQRQEGPFMDDVKVKAVIALAERKGYNEKQIRNKYKLQSLEDMTYEQFKECCDNFEKLPDKEG